MAKIHMSPRRLQALLVMILAGVTCPRLVCATGNLVLIPGGAGSTVRYAADEFCVYADKVAGKKFQVQAGDFDKALATEPETLVVLSLADAIPAGVEAPARRPAPENDGYALKNFRSGKTRGLLICSSRPVGILYGVYDYFRRFCGVGFFYDREVIWKRPLVFEKIDVLDEPAFEYRTIDFIGGHNGLPHSQPRYWQEQEWKHAIDWMLKNRINVASLILANPSLPVMAGVFERAFPEIYPDPHAGVAAAWDYPVDYRIKMMQEVLRYGRSHGLRFLYRYEYAAIPEELLKAQPELGTLMLDAARPDHRRIMLKVGRKAFELYGTDHLYSVQFAGEDPSLKDQTSRGVALGADLIRELDPKFEKILTNSWHFQTLHYTLEDGRQFCDTLRQAKVGIIAELCTNQQIYKKYDYFYGLEWWYGLVNSLAADSTFHVTPSFKYQIENVKQLLADREHGPRVRGYCLFPESFGGPALQYDFFTAVAWNPTAMSTESYFDNYIRRRMGEPTATRKEFVNAWAKAVENIKMRDRQVSNPADDWMINFHPTRFCLDGKPNLLESDISLKYPIDAAQSLYAALTTGLKLVDSGQANAATREDLVNVYIQYLSELFYLPLIEFSRAYDAYTQGRMSADEALPVMRGERDKMLHLVDAYCRILATDRRFFMSDLFARFDRMSPMNPNAQEKVREKLGSPEFIGIRNYVYEVGELVVRPEVQTLLDYLIGRVEQGDRRPATTSDKPLTEAMKPIYGNFLKADLKLRQNDGADPIATLRAGLASLKKDKVTLADYAQILTNPTAQWPMILSAGVRSEVALKPPQEEGKPTLGAAAREGVELSVRFDGKRYFIPEYGHCRPFSWKVRNAGGAAVEFNPMNLYFIERGGRVVLLDGQTRTGRVPASQAPAYQLAAGAERQGEAKTYSMGLEKIGFLCADIYLTQGGRWVTLKIPLTDLQ